MKTARRILSGLFFASSLSANALPIHLNTGDTFSYQFNSLPFLQVATYWSGTARPEGDLFWSADALTKGAQLEVKLFEDSVNDLPLYQYVFSSHTGLSGGVTLYAPSFPNIWQDMSGAFSFTVLSGSVSISNIEISNFIPIDTTHANLYRGTVSQVSEPAAVTLFFFAVTSLCFGRAVRNSRVKSEM